MKFTSKLTLALVSVLALSTGAQAETRKSVV